MAIYALVEGDAVVNLIEWDGEAPYAPPPGTAVIPIEQARAEPQVAGGAFLPDPDDAA